MPTLGSENRFPLVRLLEDDPPSAAPSGQVHLFADTDKLLYQIDDAGLITAVAGAAGGGDVATDAIWDAAGDLAIGTGADTAARLAISATAGHLLKSNGTTATWAYPTFIGCKAYHNTTQAITDSTVATVTFNSEEFDTSSFHTTTADITLPLTGYYRLTAYVYFLCTAYDTQIVQWRRTNNTATTLRSQTSLTQPLPSGGSTSSGSAVGLLTTTTYAGTAGDILNVRCYNFGASINIGDATNVEQQNFASVEFLGV